MGEIKNGHRLRSIIRHYLDGKASIEELKLLEALDEHIDIHQDAFSQLTAEEKERIRVAMLQQLKAKMHYDPKPTYSLHWIRKAAAIFIFLFLAVGIYWWLNSDNTPQPAAQLTSLYGDEVLPGGNRATLSLDGGNTILLSEDKEGVVTHNEKLTYNDGTLLGEQSSEIKYATLTTPNGGQYQVTLPDGSRVWLNAASSIRYPIRFSGKERKVELTGEAYFEVTRNEQQPFIVQSKGQMVRVLGTVFNINAYKDNGAIITTLVSGSVEVRNLGGKQQATLKPNEQALFFSGTFQVNQVDVFPYTAWKDGLIILDQADMPTLIRQLERWYDVEFIGTENLSVSGSLYAEVPREIKLSGVLQALQPYTHVKFEISGRRVLMTE